MRRRAIVAIGLLAPRFRVPLAFTRVAGAFLFMLAAMHVTSTAHAEAMADRLDVPAKMSDKSRSGLLTSVVNNGSRIVAAGQRGHVLWSDDGGKGWSQAVVPVSSDLTALHFADANTGWAVGHDGVVLHTTDGGASWSLQMDGRRLADLLAAHASSLESRGLAEAARDIARMAEQGADQSLLDVHFVDGRTGYIVGANNLVLATQDGGVHWQSISEQVDNPGALHLYAVSEAFGRIVVVGEQGLILARTGADRFEKLESPYQGSWFGLLGAPDFLLVYGLRGNAWSSRDDGATWQRAELDSSVALTAAGSTPRGDLLLTGLAGQVFRSRDGGTRFEALPLEPASPYAAIAVVDDASVVVAGVRGVQVVHTTASGEP